MSAGAAVQAAIVSALAPALDVAVFDAAPVRAALPFARVEEPIVGDWSAKDWTGREARVAVVIHDRGERPVRARALLDAVGTAVAAMTGDIGDGWRIANVRAVRERIARSGEEWRAASEFVVRVYRD